MRLLLGVSGGIAAYKALELVRLATGAGHSVRVIETASAKRFVGSASFAALSGAPVLTSEFERDPLRGSFPGEPLPEHDPASHLALVAAADAFLVAPASANTIAKLAGGLADNLVTSAALAARCPMLEHPATQANLALLRERGITIIDPGVGRLATHGEHGAGRLAEPAELLAACEAALQTGPWSGRRVLVTAGGTHEPIDAVRYIANRSSGRMGFAIAQAAAARGAEVTVIAANVALPRDRHASYVDVTTAAELAAACDERAPQADVIVMCAAVADFRPAAPRSSKLAREGNAAITLELESTDDILARLARGRRPDQVLVGFAAEHGEGGLARARAKLERKQVDLIAYNDVAQEGIGFDAQDNALTLISANGEQQIPRAPKAQIARELLDAIERLRGESG
jgi:phosphopantothenoylcysteine decarboxylase/phosphopantothenate--cysteine ligase